jgi:N-acetylmuramate 1-kinase
MTGRATTGKNTAGDSTVKRPNCQVLQTRRGFDGSRRSNRFPAAIKIGFTPISLSAVQGLQPMTQTDIRIQALHTWAEQSLDLQNIELRPLGGDAGFRRYFRFTQEAMQSHWLAVDAPPATEDSKRFVDLAALLSQSGVKVPAIKAVNIEQGFLLVEDLGDQLVYNIINPTNADAIYLQANRLIAQLQTISPPNWLEEYDKTFLTREMKLFSDWFIEKLLCYSVNEKEKIQLEKVFSFLADSAIEQPQVLVHRDFHSRNLLVCDDQSLACIDFQGALKGPLTYDAVSLLRDCYLRWPAANVHDWSLDFYQQIQSRYPAISPDTFCRWFDWMGLQRHIKVLGIFARLHLRDNKSHYLRDLPLVIRYTLDVCRQYPELASFADWFDEKLIPLAKQQSWYSDYHFAGDQ